MKNKSAWIYFGLTTTLVLLSALAIPYVGVFAVLFLLPVFWIQRRLFFRRLARLTSALRRLGTGSIPGDSPGLKWTGDDEFAELAFSVNALLETISNRTLAIQEAEARKTSIVNSLPDGLFIFDRQHRLISIVKHPDGTSEIPGFHENAPIDVTVFGRAGVEAMGNGIDAIFDGRTNVILHLESGAGPSRREYEVRLSLMDRLFAFAVIRDVTTYLAERARRLAAEQRLAIANKQESLTLLAGSIAHDVRNVLSVVNNTAEILMMDRDDPESREALDTIRDAVKRGSEMATELMTFAGQTKMNFVRIEPASLVEETKRLAGGVIGENVTLAFDLPEDLPAIDADPKQIWKVFVNLIKNASEAMHGDGQITVTAHAYTMTDSAAGSYISAHHLPAGPGVLFRFTDNGPGISPEMQRRIFDPYVSTKSSGRGFGLATVVTVISAHGGGIHLESDVGHGSTFCVFLPASRLPAPQLLSSLQPSSKPVLEKATPLTATQKIIVDLVDPNAKAVLLVDDDNAILRTTSIILKMLKYNVSTATSHVEAIALFRRLSRDLVCVILDAHLGSADPIRLLSTFRAIDPRVPVIISSGSPAEQIKAMFAAQPYDGFLGKPYTMAELKYQLSTVRT